MPTTKRIILCAPIPAYKDSWGINDSIIANGVIPYIKTFARQEGLEYLDLYTPMTNHKELLQNDGIHPNEKGVVRIAELVADKIKTIPQEKKTKKRKKKNRK